MANEMTRFDPFDDFRQLRRLMERFSGGPIGLQDFENAGYEAKIPVDVYEKDRQLVVRAAMPGVEPDDIQVNVRDGVLTITAETRREQDVDEGGWLRHEYRYGRMSRALRLPNDVDLSKAEARYEHGVLRLYFPHTQGDRSREHRIEVRSAEGGGGKERRIEQQGSAQGQASPAQPQGQQRDEQDPGQRQGRGRATSKA
jgi:HSP20 family protein